MAFIFWIGTDRGSATETRSLIQTLLDRWWPELVEQIGSEGFVRFNVVLRKLGHFVGYALLGILDARCIRGRWGTLSRRGCFMAWTAATIWAAVDEFHQSFSASRGATVEDVALDAFGAAAGITLYSLCLRRYQQKT